MKITKSKYYVPALLLVYLLKVYGSLILYKLDLISGQLWCDIHYIGIAIILCMFFFYIKEKLNSLVFSVGISIFTSRLITQLFCDGDEYWWEMICIITASFIIYKIQNKFNKK